MVLFGCRVCVAVVGVFAVGSGVTAMDRARPPAERRVHDATEAAPAPGVVGEQALRAVWARYFGGANADGFGCVDQTVDGGYIVVGNEYSWGNGGADGWVMKLDSSGTKVWSRTFGGTGTDSLRSVDATPDGGCIVAGDVSSWGQGGGDGWLIKLDPDGNTTWSRTYGGTGYDVFCSVQQTTEGGYVMAGYESSWGLGGSDGWVMKVDESGNKTWSSTFGGWSDDELHSVQQTSDGGYIVAGSVISWSSAMDDDGWVIKLDSSGNKTWSKSFGGTATDRFLSVREASSGGYIVVGYEESWGMGVYEGWVMKLASNGNKSWGKTFGGTQNDLFQCVRQTTDGGYVVTGYETSWGQGGYDGWVVKLTSSGTKTWSRTFGGTSGDYLNSGRQTSDGGYIVAGSESSWGHGDSDGWVLKLSSSGNR